MYDDIEEDIGRIGVKRPKEEQHEQNLRDLQLIRDDPGWALTAVQEWRRLKAENERLREALRALLRTAREVDIQAASIQLGVDVRAALSDEGAP